jgi:hypothetical protein
MFSLPAEQAAQHPKRPLTRTKTAARLEQRRCEGADLGMASAQPGDERAAIVGPGPAGKLWPGEAAEESERRLIAGLVASTIENGSPT